MKHNFSTEDLRAAIQAAHRKSFDLPAIVTSELEFILDELPDPQPADEWEECEFPDYKAGDRARVTDTVSGDVAEFEIIAKAFDEIDGATTNIRHSQHQKYERIPAKIQHPDPAKQWVIRVSGAYNVDWPETYAYVSDGSGYCMVHPTSDSRLLPEAITSWSPAKVVADDE